MKMEWWNSQTVSKYRCPTCWLRQYECFCTEIKDMANELSSFSDENCSLQIKIKICMYYHYQEIGRSANTAHLYEAICCNTNKLMFNECEVIVFGDSAKEVNLINEISDEIDMNQIRTCVLYPGPSSKLIHKWIADQVQCPDFTNRVESKIDKSPRIVEFRFVVLDGTYHQASRMYRYLAKSLELLHGPSKRLPLVKLDLGESGKCRSALYGIQSQPGIDKLCSFQAVVMAVQQLESSFYKANEDHFHEFGISCIQNAKYDFMFACLDNWLKHVLSKKIKYGKRTQNFKLDLEAASYVKELVDRNLAQLTNKTSHQPRKGNDSTKQCLWYTTNKHESIHLQNTRRFSVLYLI